MTTSVAPTATASTSPAPSSSAAGGGGGQQLSILQSRRLASVRTLLHADQVTAIARPPVTMDTETSAVPSVEEMIALLAPYHVNQDMDNSIEAIAKGTHHRALN